MDDNLNGPILITGAGGFVGFNLLNYLINTDHEVYGVFSHPHLNWRLKRQPIAIKNIITADLLDPQFFKQLKHIKPKYIFHLAAYGAYSHQSDPALIYQTNVIATAKLIDTLLPLNCVKSFISTGSSSEYGLNCTNTTENSDLVPNSHYAVSKISVAYLLKYYQAMYKFPSVHLRLYSVYGPWEEPTRFIPSLITNGLSGKYPPLVNQDISRDFIYVQDVIGALVKAAKLQSSIQPINVCTGQPTTIKQAVETLRNILKLKIKPQFSQMPNRAWDTTNWYGNPEFAKKIMNWTADTIFSTGLQKTIDWTKSNS